MAREPAPAVVSAPVLLATTAPVAPKVIISADADDAVEWSAIAGALSASLLEHPRAASIAHGRMLRLAREDSSPRRYPRVARPTQRNYYDDWDFFVDEVRPLPLTEWRKCLSWLCRGAQDESTTASCLSRPEAAIDGRGDVVRSEALLERPFSAGSLRCVLSCVDTLGHSSSDQLRIRMMSWNMSTHATPRRATPRHASLATKPSQATPRQAKPSQVKPSQAKSSQVESSQVKSSQKERIKEQLIATASSAFLIWQSSAFLIRHPLPS